MIAATVTLLALIYSFIVLVTGFAGIRVSDPRKAILSCRIFFLLQLVDKQARYAVLLLKALSFACAALICLLISSSKHFIVTLDILFFMSALILIVCHALNTAKASPMK